MASLTEALWDSSRRQVENSDRLTEELRGLLPHAPTEVTLAPLLAQINDLKGNLYYNPSCTKIDNFNNIGQDIGL